jgi:hypothetical protein
VDETLLEQHDAAPSPTTNSTSSPIRRSASSVMTISPAARPTPTRAAAKTNAKGKCCQVTMADQ